MTERETLALYEKTGALMRGHFRLTSGLHSDVYLQSALVLQHPEHAEALGRTLGDAFQDAGARTVLAPAIGGILVAHEVARALGVRAIFAERQDGRLTLRRGFTLAPGEKVLVVEDVVTTGGSTRETIEVARAAGAEVVGAASIIDRSRPSTGSGQAAAHLDVPYHALATVSLPTFEPGSCPLCAAGSPVVKPGSRA